MEQSSQRHDSWEILKHINKNYRENNKLEFIDPTIISKGRKKKPGEIFDELKV